MSKKSIYVAVVEESARRRRHEAWLDRGIAEFAKWVLPLIIKWEKRKPPEYQAVLRSLEMRG